MQIKALMAEEKRKTAEAKRKQELHDLDVRQRETQMTGTAGSSTSAAIVPVDDVGESLLSVSNTIMRQEVRTKWCLLALTRSRNLQLSSFPTWVCTTSNLIFH